MNHLNGVALTIVVASFVIVTYIGFASARWHPAEGPMQLNERGLGGRGFGTFVSWFLLGGDIYTAYTFIAAPALVYAARGRGVLRAVVHDHGVADRVGLRAAAVVGRPRAATSARASSSGDGTDRRDSGSRWRPPGSWPPCRISRCSSSASSRC
jgi:hypothetical protein